MELPAALRAGGPEEAPVLPWGTENRALKLQPDTKQAASAILMSVQLQAQNMAFSQSP